MATVSLDIWTGAYPSISNDITVEVYAQSDPLAVIASATHAAPHLADSWSFPGLDRTNYLFKIFETNAGVKVQQLGGNMNVVPGSAGGINTRPTEQIEADITTGLTSGTNSFTFDGTGGTEDWRGWDIDTIDRIAQGPMKRNVDYSWVPGTAVFTLLGAGDLFAPNEWFNVQFVAQISEGVDSTPTTLPLFTTPKKITANYSVDAGNDMQGILIVDPAGAYMEVTMPDIATVVAGRLLTIEMRRQTTMKCMKLKTYSGGEAIDWLNNSVGGVTRTALYALPQESFSIYKWIDPAGPTSMWRIYRADGNFLNVGNSTWSDADPTDVFNQILFDGATLDIFQYARIYNEYVLGLDGSMKCNFDDWATGNNKYKFSLANSSNPAFANKFKIPDRRYTTDKNTDGVILPGFFEDGQVGAFNANVVLSIGDSFTGPAGGGWSKIPGRGQSNPGNQNYAQNFNVGKQNRVPSVIQRKYLYV